MTASAARSRRRSPITTHRHERARWREDPHHRHQRHHRARTREVARPPQRGVGRGTVPRRGDPRRIQCARCRDRARRRGRRRPRRAPCGLQLCRPPRVLPRRQRGLRPCRHGERRGHRPRARALPASQGGPRDVVERRVRAVRGPVVPAERARPDRRVERAVVADERHVEGRRGSRRAVLARVRWTSR